MITFKIGLISSLNPLEKVLAEESVTKYDMITFKIGLISSLNTLKKV